MDGDQLGRRALLDTLVEDEVVLEGVFEGEFFEEPEDPLGLRVLELLAWLIFGDEADGH